MKMHHFNDLLDSMIEQKISKITIRWSQIPVAYQWNIQEKLKAAGYDLKSDDNVIRTYELTED